MLINRKSNAVERFLGAIIEKTCHITNALIASVTRKGTLHHGRELLRGGSYN